MKQIQIPLRLEQRHVATPLHDMLDVLRVGMEGRVVAPACEGLGVVAGTVALLAAAIAIGGPW